MNKTPEEIVAIVEEEITEEMGIAGQRKKAINKALILARILARLQKDE